MRKRSFPKHENEVLEKFLSGFAVPGARRKDQTKLLKMGLLAGADLGNFQRKLPKFETRVIPRG